MVTIHASHPLTFPRSYVAGFAIFRTDISARFEGASIIINDEVLGLDIRLNINSEIYPARSRICFTDEVIQSASAVDDVTGDAVNLDINVWVDVPPTYADVCICISYAELIEPPTFLDLPDMPSSYWFPTLPNGKLTE